MYKGDKWYNQGGYKYIQMILYTTMYTYNISLRPCLFILAVIALNRAVVSCDFGVLGSCALKGAEYGAKPRVQLGLQYEGKVNVLGKRLGQKTSIWIHIMGAGNTSWGVCQNPRNTG